MVMGNRDEMSGTGVVFSRNPSTGARGLFGEYLPVAQGEDLVSGVRTPQSIDALKSQMPDVYEELEGLSRDLEQHFHDMQDVEFTVESGNLFMLQTRSGKRSGQAAVKIAVDMVEDGLLTRQTRPSSASPPTTSDRSSTTASSFLNATRPSPAASTPPPAQSPAGSSSTPWKPFPSPRPPAA